MENIIQTSHLTKRYGSKIAVNDLNLSIHKGEVSDCSDRTAQERRQRS